MVKTEEQPNDWLNSTDTSLLAWWLPKLAIFVAVFAAVPLRAVVWVLALLWMATACILNARRCGRTHCRYTAPYYLAMILPVLALASGLISASVYTWLALALLILIGGWVIRWTTEQKWGRYSNADAAIGPKRTWPRALHMSAFGDKADVAYCGASFDPKETSSPGCLPV
jgi:hypothetical protein